jgi:hypothetical protein
MDLWSSGFLPHVLGPSSQSAIGSYKRSINVTWLNFTKIIKIACYKDLVKDVCRWNIVRRIDVVSSQHQGSFEYDEKLSGLDFFSLLKEQAHFWAIFCLYYCELRSYLYNSKLSKLCVCLRYVGFLIHINSFSVFSFFLKVKFLVLLEGLCGSPVAWCENKSPEGSFLSSRRELAPRSEFAPMCATVTLSSVGAYVGAV